MQSSPTKRRRPRDSPLLQPLTQRSLPQTHPEPSGAACSPPRKPVPRLSQETRRRWLLEALKTLDGTSLSLELQQQMVDSPQHRRTVDSSLIETPTLASTEDKVAQLLTSYAAEALQNPVLSNKPAPGTSPEHAALPLYARANGKQRSPIKPPHKISPTKLLSGRVAIAPLLSTEMLATLHAHLEEKIRGNHWQNEIRSRLARPLSATVFSNRHEQLCHELSAPQYLAGAIPFSDSAIPLYPYSIEAHDWSRRIGRMYRKHCYRQEILTNVRRLAVAIRFFRRVIIPWLVRAHRRRRQAAIRIQRRMRRFHYWKHHVLRPFVERFVAHVTRVACSRIKASIVLATTLKRLVHERRVREHHARERRRVLFRWVAKTRVALFVHKVWCRNWFRGKRERNLARLRNELAQLEASDTVVHAEYSTIFTTVFGRTLLKKELTAWRLTIKKSPVTQSPILAEDTPAVSDTVVRLRQCFAIFDMDGSGALDLDEFELMLAHLRATIIKHPSSPNDTKRAKLTTAQVRDLFESLDRDGNGSVTCSEFEAWWIAQSTDTGGHHDVASGSASVSLLTTGLDRLVLTGHGMLFWLLGKKQQLESKFIKKRLIKKAQTSAKCALLASWCHDEASSSHDETRRCRYCARRFGLQRDLDDHTTYQCRADGTGDEWVVDTFVWKKWVREEELRLLEHEQMDGNGDDDDEEEDEVKSDERVEGE